MNQCSLRHSSRRRPLKLSTYAFWFGLPGSMKCRVDTVGVGPGVERPADVCEGAGPSRRWLHAWTFVFDNEGCWALPRFGETADGATQLIEIDRFAEEGIEQRAVRVHVEFIEAGERDHRERTAAWARP
jgi:hypothetical protein